MHQKLDPPVSERISGNLGTFAQGIGHDLNNILTTVLGYSQLALVQFDRPELVREALAQIEVAGHRAQELVQELMGVSDHHGFAHSYIPIQLMIKETLSLLSVMIPPGVQISLKLPFSPVVLALEPLEELQLLMNLIRNSLHALGSQGGTIEIKLEKSRLRKHRQGDQPHGESLAFWMLTVRDSGCGMAAEVCKEIFTPFYTTKSDGKGHGLGLTIVHEIVTKHHGFIKVKSSLKGGTSFMVFLPCENANMVSLTEGNGCKNFAESC